MRWPPTWPAGRRARPDDEQVSYPWSGHLVRLGTLPTDAPWTGGIALGGDRAGQAAANRDATARVLGFLGRVVPAAREQRARL